ncbi:MAG: hypothetical protein AB1567_03880 [bacterium]
MFSYNFKILKLKEYIDLLNNKIPLIDWNLPLLQVLSSYPNTNYLEHAIQCLLCWVYTEKTKSKPLSSVVPYLKAKVREGNDGCLSLLTKKQLIEQGIPLKEGHQKLPDCDYCKNIRTVRANTKEVEYIKCPKCCGEE